MELTDGWYSIHAVLDKPLISLMVQGKLRVGDKVMLSSSELLGGHDGCSPLEVSEQ